MHLIWSNVTCRRSKSPRVCLPLARVTSRTFVFLERSDNLRVAVLGDVKVILAKAGNGLSLFVGDNHVHHNDAAFGSDGGALNRRGKRRSLLLGARETEPREKKERAG